MGKAIGYMMNRWDCLRYYISDGRLEIDNDLVENAMRPITLGRKNYLFAGSHDSAQRAAIIYAMVANAGLAVKNPFGYLRDVLSRIADHPYHRVTELLACNWQSLPAQSE
jgi:transposase